MSERVDDLGGSKTANQKPVVCARCHSLRHYQKLKDLSVENLLPNFDFNHAVGTWEEVDVDKEGKNRGFISSGCF